MSTCILLATFNGEPHLPQLLDSLLAQTTQDWQLLVRDDGSSDSTPEIVRRAACVDRRIHFIRDARGRLGPAHNFGALMEAALVGGFRHVAFADQDDVWIPQKLERQLQHMHRAEDVGGAELPLLVHSDLTVVDERLAVLHESFMRCSGLPFADRVSLATLIVRNHVVGCTMLANRPLLELAVPAPPEMAMHDWWLGLLAVTCGRLRYDDTPLVLYRQHSNNEVGATNLEQKLRAGWRDWRTVWDRALSNFRKGELQAQALRDRLRQQRQDSPMLPLVDDYCRLFDGTHGRLSRLWRMQRLGIRVPGLVRQATLLARAFAVAPPMPNHSRIAS